jgi:lipopolysaccharide transport system ATP-binding protein
VSHNAIRIENIGKRYFVDHETRDQRYGYTTLRDSLANLATAPVRRLWGRRQTKREEFWALKDVSFEVQPGEVTGIIGRNGAGKSTLLKVLSQITKPTTGKIHLRGRVGSLLEVGTGFHPELTGRENIYLNGSILGMRKAEIDKKFDEIVDFAETEQFLDTPVKRYSSGMFVRLAFAVAASLDTEILIIDEVLAVGDGNFQTKCLNKMEDVGRHGRTVLFVSHNMQAVTRLCQRAVLLEHGAVAADGGAPQIASRYLRGEGDTAAHREWTNENLAPQNDVARLLSVRVIDSSGATSEAIDIRQPVAFEMVWRVLKSGQHLSPNFHVYNEDGTCVFIVSDRDPQWQQRPRPAGLYTTTAFVPGNFFAEGGLAVGAAVSTFNPVVVHFFERDAVAFQVVDPMEGDSVRGEYAGPYPGVVRPQLNWTNDAVLD